MSDRQLVAGSFGSRFESLGRLRIFVHAVDAGSVFLITGIALIFIAADGQEGDDDDGDGSVSAVAVTVFDDIGQAGDGNGHRGDDDESRDHGSADDRAGADFFQDIDFRKTSGEAEDCRDAGGNEAQHQEGTVDDGQPR